MKSAPVVHETGAANLKIETASGSTNPVTGPAAATRRPRPTRAGSEATDELELNAISCAGSAARAKVAQRNPADDGTITG